MVKCLPEFEYFYCILNNKQTNFYLRSDNNMLHMSRYNMYNYTSYRGGCAKK